MSLLDPYSIHKWVWHINFSQRGIDNDTMYNSLWSVKYCYYYHYAIGVIAVFIILPLLHWVSCILNLLIMAASKFTTVTFWLQFRILTREPDSVFTFEIWEEKYVHVKLAWIFLGICLVGSLILFPLFRFRPPKWVLVHIHWMHYS